MQCYGVEDARISRVGDRWLMTTCSVSPERHSTTLYSSDNGLDWRFEDIVLDHQNKDMLIFEGADRRHNIGRRPGRWATSISPIRRAASGVPGRRSTWRPHPTRCTGSPIASPASGPHAGTVATARMGGGTPPILTDEGWLTLVARRRAQGDRRHLPHLLVAARPGRSRAASMRTSRRAAARGQPGLTRPIEHQMYLRDVVFTTGIADGDEGGAAPGHYIIALGEADLAPHVCPEGVFHDRGRSHQHCECVYRANAGTGKAKASSAASGGKRGRCRRKVIERSHRHGDHFIRGAQRFQRAHTRARHRKTRRHQAVPAGKGIKTSLALPPACCCSAISAAEMRL